MMQDLERLFPLPPRPEKPGFRRWLRRLLWEVCMRAHPAMAGCRPCRYNIIPHSLRVCHEPEADFPVDVLITWVDGSDPTHAAKRAEWEQRKNPGVRVDGLQAARFRDNGELRYTIRALEMYAPWVRRIILVTDNQRPDWLDTDNERIRVADHREFIPEEFLPTFNSHVIEAFLHNIPGLAEHYIYLNDDVFLARPCRKTDFFTPNGLPLAFVDWRKRRWIGYWKTRTPHALSYFNTLAILKRRKVRTDGNFITAHGPYPETLSNARDAFAFYEKEIAAFAANRFRTNQELALYSHGLPLYLYGQKRLVPCDERYFYVQTIRKDRLAYYKGLLRSHIDHVPPLFFCLNDVQDDGTQPTWREDLHVMLSTYFPLPSRYERDAASFSVKENSVPGDVFAGNA